MTRSIGVACLLLAGALHPAPAQSKAVKRAAGTITEADIHRRIFLIADDSMGGRNTPSPGLTKTANYIASEFRRFGLKPGGDSGTYLLRYPIASRQVLPAVSSVRFGSEGMTITTTLAEGAALLAGATSTSAKGSIVVVGGTVNVDSLKAEELKDRIVLYVPATNPQQGPGGDFRTRQRLIRLGARAVVVVVSSDSLFGNYQRNQLRARTTVGDPARGAPTLAIREGTIIAQVPQAAEHFAELRSAPGTLVQVMTEWEGEIALRDTTLAIDYAPDVVGILEGSDPVLRVEYLVYSAHMDHIGFSRTSAQMPDSLRAHADTINNGADDDGSGTVGVVELAEAFSQ